MEDEKPPPLRHWAVSSQPLQAGGREGLRDWKMLPAFNSTRALNPTGLTKELANLAHLNHREIKGSETAVIALQFTLEMATKWRPRQTLFQRATNDRKMPYSSTSIRTCSGFGLILIS